MNRRSFLIAAVNAELKAKLAIQKYDKEFGQNGNQNQRGNSPSGGQNLNAQGNVPQQPVYGG